MKSGRRAMMAWLRSTRKQNPNCTLRPRKVGQCATNGRNCSDTPIIHAPHIAEIEFGAMETHKQICMPVTRDDDDMLAPLFAVEVKHLFLASGWCFV